MITLRPITLDECQQVRIWRNAPDVFPMLRTGYKTEEQQAAFYRDVVCNPNSNHRYYALEAVRLGYANWNGEFEPTRTPTFIGIGGLTYLDRVPGEAEISLVLGPDFRRSGLGTAAVDALLVEAFGRLGLSAVTGECYAANPAKGFWRTVVPRRPPVRASIDPDGAMTWRWLHP